MTFHIITIGRPKLLYATEGFAFYIKRLRHFHRVEVTHIRDNQHASDKMLAQMDASSYNILLDEHGKQFSSEELSVFLSAKKCTERGPIQFFIGGPDGHSPAIKEQADYVWALSRLTFPHDMAMLLSAEALYRATTIASGHPYHRTSYDTTT